MPTFLEFEKPIAEIESKIEELRHITNPGDDINIAEEVGKLQQKVDRLLRQTYAKLTAQQKVQVARHPSRPHCVDYIQGLIADFTPLAGDRRYGDDAAIVGGLGRFRDRSVMVIGHEKGNDTETRVKHNFGMAKPDGYRKAQRLMRMAERFGIPVVTLVDTAGAYPGVASEERGQAEAIAESIRTCLSIEVPLISIIIGEGGSGGAVALASADRIHMLEHSVYSVISPEGCASILWRSSDNVADAAAALRLTAQDLLELGVIDRVIAEPVGGAHRDVEATVASVGRVIWESLTALDNKDGPALRRARREKFLEMGKRGLA